MKIKDFGVEMYLNAYENDCKYNLAETCVSSMTVNELLEMTGEKDKILNDILSSRLTYGHIEGSPDFKESICGLYKKMKPENIVTAHGAIGANYLVINSLVEPGDEVIVPGPTYVAYNPGVIFAGGTPVPVVTTQDTRFKLTPEALKAAGAQGVLINHCERPMTLSAIKKTIDRANELDMFSFVCADTVEEAKAVAQLGPDIVNPEPSELIGSGQASDMSYVMDAIKAVKEINPDILVEQAAGITTAQQIYDFIMAGSEAAGSASGILNSERPFELLDEMVSYVKKARKDLIRQGRIKA